MTCSKAEIIKQLPRKKALDKILEWAEDRRLTSAELVTLVNSANRLTIEEIAKKGYVIQIGPHVEGLKGYYAVFVRPGEINTNVSWVESGHSLTVIGAIYNARDVFNGEIAPGSEEFEIDDE